MQQEVATVQVSKPGLAVWLTCDGLAERTRQALEDTGGDQKAANLGWLLRQDLLADVLQEETMDRRQGLEQGGGVRMTTERQSQQVDADHPPLSLLFECMLNLSRTVQL